MSASPPSENKRKRIEKVTELESFNNHIVRVGKVFPLRILGSATNALVRVTFVSNIEGGFNPQSLVIVRWAQSDYLGRITVGGLKFQEQCQLLLTVNREDGGGIILKGPFSVAPTKKGAFQPELYLEGENGNLKQLHPWRFSYAEAFRGQVTELAETFHGIDHSVAMAMAKEAVEKIKIMAESKYWHRLANIQTCRKISNKHVKLYQQLLCERWLINNAPARTLVPSTMIRGSMHPNLNEVNMGEALNELNKHGVVAPQRGEWFEDYQVGSA